MQMWDGETAPEGYALCPDEFFAIFYSTTPAGFVNITVEDGVVTAMEVNQEALDTYLASLPEDGGDETPVDPIEELQEENKKLRARLDEQTEIINILLNGED